MKRFEYKIITNLGTNEKEIEKELDDLGEFGWELCILDCDGYYTFKREIEEHHPYE